MKSTRHIQALTLVEMLVALIVTGILLSAVATLAFAMNSAGESSSDVLSKQSQLRHTTLRVSELLRHCKLVCAAPDNDLAIWQADDNGDGRINLNELVYLERGEALDILQLSQFDSTETLSVTLAELSVPGRKSELLSSYGSTSAALLPACKNVAFALDAAAPYTQFVTLSFDLTEDYTDHRYEISVALRSWAGHLLNDAGDALVSDDD